MPRKDVIRAHVPVWIVCSNADSVASLGIERLCRVRHWIYGRRSIFRNGAVRLTSNMPSRCDGSTAEPQMSGTDLGNRTRHVPGYNAASPVLRWSPTLPTTPCSFLNPLFYAGPHLFLHLYDHRMIEFGQHAAIFRRLFRRFNDRSRSMPNVD